ncbi:MAG: PEP-CTERM sorting domain-containing protein [Candidatus Scalindua sp.]|nr:PEP-CTERM sorting domain-containing protein [Candidatus Scalindua sp.]
MAVRNGNVATVPEPSLELLLGISLIGLVGVVRRIRQRK